MSTGTGIEGLQGITTITGVHGVLRGIIDAELAVWDPIPEAEIVAVVTEDAGRVVTHVESGARRAAAQVPHDEVQKAAAMPGALKGRTDADGRFVLASRPTGGSLRVYACFKAIRAARGGLAPLRKDVCFDLGVHSAREPLALAIPHSLYCALKGLADQWTVCGRVSECSTGQAVSGAVVKAFDADWVQHDSLGSGVSNASGVYRVDYPGSAFRPGTWIDIELFGGPDLYFRVEDSVGGTLITEEPPAGRAPGRADRGHCGRVDLCAAVGAQPDPDKPGTDRYPNAWIKVGSAFAIPDAAGLNDFDAEGYMGASRFALSGTVLMRGDVARQTADGHPVEYRFLVSDSPTANGGPPPADATFTRVVGEGAGVPLFANGVVIGEMVRLSPLRIVKIDARTTDLRDGGWLRVNDCIQRVFSTTPGLNVADIGSFLWNPDALLGLNTAALTTAPNVPAGAAPAGSTVPVGDEIPTERFALRFQIRSVNPADDTDVDPMPGDGITLNSVVMNNNAPFLKLAVQADGTTVLCDPASGNITLPFTAYHPQLQSVSIGLHPNGSPNVFNAAPLVNNTNPAVTESRDPALFVGTLSRCSYIASLGASVRQHNGEGQLSYGPVQATFFYE
jgi:hypothetical protein